MQGTTESFFFNKLITKLSTFLTKRAVLDKNYIISERSEDGVSSYVFISIMEFLMNIDLFLGRWGGVGGGLKNMARCTF